MTIDRLFVSGACAALLACSGWASAGGGGIDVDLRVVADFRGVELFVGNSAGEQKDLNILATSFLAPVNVDTCLLLPAHIACTDTESGYFGIGANGFVDGFSGTGMVSSVKNVAGGTVVATLEFSVTFEISGLAPGQKYPFTLSGSLWESGGNGTVKLTGPSTSFIINTNANWYQTLELANGTYFLSATAITSVFGSAIGQSSVDLEIGFFKGVAPPSSCGAGSCFLIRAEPGCDNLTCCGLVCAADPSCCDASWDEACAIAAGDLCAIQFVTDPVVNPANGRRHRLISARDYVDANVFATANAFKLADVENGRDNRWIRDTFVQGVPALAGGLVGGGVRIGLADFTTEGVWVWASGRPFSYARWAQGQPDNAGNQDSVEMNSLGLWSDIALAQPRLALAERFIQACGSGGSCFVQHGPGCDDESCCNEICLFDPICCSSGWDALCVQWANAHCAPSVLGQPIVDPATGHAYLVVSGASWQQAERLARTLRGHLVALDEPGEAEWLRRNVLAVPGGPEEVWIGAHDQLFERSFQWTNGGPFPRAPWAEGEPDNNDNDEEGDFLVLQADGTWADRANRRTIAGIIEIPCSGDLDGDGLIGASDLALLLGAWASPGPFADLDADAVVGSSDLGLLLGAWGPCPTSSACTPRATAGSDQPGCSLCVCAIDPACCATAWDADCVELAATACSPACRCGI